MPNSRYGLMGHLDIYVDGAAVDTQTIADMLDCTVQNSLHLPDMCEIRFYDRQFAYAGSANFNTGASIKINAGYDQDQGNMQTIFQGEVVAVHADMDADGVPSTVVRCYHKTHRLHRGRNCRSFVNVTDSDIVSSIVGAAGLAPDVDPTTVVHDWVFQNNQTNWEFITQRAARCGYQMYGSGDSTLNFKRLPPSAGEPITLKWGDDLRSFRPHLSASPQVSTVSVRGWDVTTKQPIVGTATSPTASDQALPSIGAGSGSSTASSAFGDSTVTVSDRPMFSQTEAQQMAQSIFDDVSGSFVEAEGLSYGNMQLVPGANIQIANIGGRFNGTYYITSSTHVYSSKEGYTTHFSVSGKRPSTMAATGGDWDGAGHKTTLGGNVLVGVVTDNNDPDNLGRIKVKYPTLTEEDASWWARIASPMGGPNRGMLYVPEINDEVLLAFEHGDIHRPYVLGGLWNGVDLPPLPSNEIVSGGNVVRRLIQTRLGHRFLIKDTDDNGGIALITKHNHRIEFHDDDDKILIQTNKGHHVLLDDDNSKIVVMDFTENNSMTIDSIANSIAFLCNGDFTVTAQGAVKIKAEAGIELDTPAGIDGNAGAEIGLACGADMMLSSGADLMASSGASMELSGGGDMTVTSAGPIDITSAAEINLKVL